MTDLKTIRALQKSEALQMRGRGCGGYAGDDFDFDFGCFDWEVVCTPEGGHIEDYDPYFDWGDYVGVCFEYYDDIDWYHTIYLSHEYDYRAYEFHLALEQW